MRTCRRLFVLASLAAAAVSANALSVDPQISIDRALNSPTLSVRYTGVTATLVELRINGESISTREVSSSRNLGETNFTIDLDALKNGDNLVEIRLFDRTGKLVAQDKTNISTEKGSKGPVFVDAPKAGATVMGPVEIKIGFGEKLSKSYVSFFVDGNFKAITNFPPFVFNLDTEKESNGWHDIEAWAIDEFNVTHKTGSVRMFVNNPGGRTNRVGAVAAAAPSRNFSQALGLVGADAGIRALNGASTSLLTRGTSPQSLPPAVVERMMPKGNVLKAMVSGANAVRPIILAGAVSTGPKSLVPTGARIAKVAATVAAPTTTVATTAAQNVARTASVAQAIQANNAVMAATTLVAVTRGTRLPDLGTYTILLDSQPVRFDVAPRVEDGMALAPLRQIIEKAGGKVEWEHATKTVRAGSEGHMFELKIGGATAKVDGQNLVLEKAAGLERGRTIIPLSFLRDALGMDVQYDKSTGNVVVSSHK